MSAYRSSLFWSLKKEVSEKLPQALSQIGCFRNPFAKVLEIILFNQSVEQPFRGPCD